MSAEGWYKGQPAPWSPADSSGLAGLSDQVGPLVPNHPDDQTRALTAALRCAADADEAARFVAMLGLAGDVAAAWDGGVLP